MNNLNNLITLTSAALLTGFLDAAARPQVRAFGRANDGSTVAANAHANCATDSVPNARDCFLQHHQWPVNCKLNTNKGFSQVRDIFKGLTREGLIGFGQEGVNNNTLLNMSRKLSSSDLEAMTALIDVTQPSQCPGAAGNGPANSARCANYAAGIILSQSNPSKWTKNMLTASVDHVFSHAFCSFTLGQVNKMNVSAVEEHAVTILRHLRNKGRIHMVQPHILKAILKNAAAIALITPADFVEIVTNPDLAKIFKGDVFEQLSLAVKQGARVGKFVRNLPKDVFANVTAVLSPDFYTYANAPQLSKWQEKTFKAHKCTLRADLINPALAGSVPVKVWTKYFTDVTAQPQTAWAANQQATLGAWQFWKRLDVKVIKDLAEQQNIGTFLPAGAFKVMTKEQRQVILSAGDKDGSATSCADLPMTILKGKESRRTGLKASKKCFESKLGVGTPPAGKWLFRGLVNGMFDAKVGKKFDAAMLPNFKATVKRTLKKGPDGKDIEKSDYEFTGLLALEGLRKHPNGADFVKAFLTNDDGSVVTACAAIQVDSLKKARWLQPLLNKECVKNIPGITMDDAKKLHPHVVSLLSKAQVEALGDKDDLKDLEGTIVEGLAGNRAFAKMSCEKREKTNKDGDDVEKKPLMILVKASERSKYFGHKYVMNLPSEDDCQRYMSAHIASFADDALAGSDAAWIAGHAALMQNIRPEQYGRISDNVEAGSYPASLQAGAASSMSIDRVKNLSSKFVGRMSASALGAFSADQVKAIPASSLVEVCGADKHAALKGLSDEQKASLGKSCATKEGSMAPVNAHVGAFAAVVAAAAGSLALLL